MLGKRLEGKSVILVGASKGIGKGIAKVFASEGASLLLVSRNEELLQNLCKENENMNYFIADVSKESDMNNMANKAIELYGRIDVLCQNAGIYPEKRLEDMEAKDFEHVLNTNLKGTFLAIKACLNQMKSQNYGRIVITSSISGPKVGLPGFSHYTASKGGITGFIKTAAIELAKYKITVNGIEPGNIMTEGLDGLGEKYLSVMRKAIPLGDLGTPEDIAYAALFLASDEAKFITGENIVVDGGQILPESHFAEY